MEAAVGNAVQLHSCLLVGAGRHGFTLFGGVYKKGCGDRTFGSVFQFFFVKPDADHLHRTRSRGTTAAAQLAVMLV